MSTVSGVYECSIDVEDPDGYDTGRYFPVTLGTVFKNGRYRVLQKLGWGGFATIWLARDNMTASNVALKVINMKNNAREFQVLHHLQHSSAARDNACHPGRRSVVQLLDDFNLSSLYKCLVLPVMGMNLQTRMETDDGLRLKKQVASSICRQVTLGLDYLWKCGIAHGDLHSKNVLFTTSTTSQLSKGEIMSRLGPPVTGEVKRKDGGCRPHNIPSYLVRPVSIRGSNSEVKIMDFGNAFFHDDPPTRLYNPWHVRPPESLYGQPLSKAVDMWSMGCLVFELITGRTFMDSFLPNKAEMMTGLKKILGHPPPKWYKYVDRDILSALENVPTGSINLGRYLQLNYDQDDNQLLALGEDEEEIPIEEYEKPPPEFTTTELAALAEVLSRLLSYKPQARGSPATLLEALSCLGKEKAHDGEG